MKEILVCFNYKMLKHLSFKKAKSKQALITLPHSLGTTALKCSKHAKSGGGRRQTS